MIYLDYAASSIKRKEILQEILDNMEDFDGNPASTHASGRRAKEILEGAREKLARSIGADKDEIVFTSGASESNNTIIENFKGKKILTSNIGHDSILNPVNGANTIYLKADQEGMISIDDLKKNLDGVSLLALTYVNNELGSIQRVEEIGEILAKRKVHFHLDAVQAYGHLDIDVKKIKCDSLSLSGHKIGGLNGFGLLYLKGQVKPLIKGGDQEKDRRAGTSYTMGAFSMAKAFDKAILERDHIREIKKYFLEKLQGRSIEFEVNGSLDKSSDHIVNLYFPKLKSDFLLTYLDMNGILASAGSACRAGSLKPSKTIANVYGEERASHSIRFSFGFTNTKEDIDKVVEVLGKVG
ncbi:MAG: cysteine desulfurase family protein [Anaerococcus sp.]|nr:cysteine desulfurase family protein [Anaerococcus sp.]